MDRGCELVSLLTCEATSAPVNISDLILWYNLHILPILRYSGLLCWCKQTDFAFNCVLWFLKIHYSGKASKIHILLILDDFLFETSINLMYQTLLFQSFNSSFQKYHWGNFKKEIFLQIDEWKNLNNFINNSSPICYWRHK